MLRFATIAAPNEPTMLGHGSVTMTLDTYGHLFDDRLDEVGEAMDRARAAAHGRRDTLRALPVLPQCCPSAIWEEMPTGPRPAFPLVRAPCRTCTPDRIRTGATAVRGRRARPLHNGGRCCSHYVRDSSDRWSTAPNRPPRRSIPLGY